MSLFIANYGRELRIGINIRRKDRESDGIYRKNEESTRRSRSNIEENTGGNKVISR